MFLRISQNSLEYTCTRICFLTKLQAAPTTLLKRWLWRSCFPENFANFSQKPFLKNPTPVAASILYLNYCYNLNLCLSKLSTFPKQQYSYYGISNICLFCLQSWFFSMNNSNKRPSAYYFMFKSNYTCLLCPQMTCAEIRTAKSSNLVEPDATTW